MHSLCLRLTAVNLHCNFTSMMFAGVLRSKVAQRVQHPLTLKVQSAENFNDTASYGAYRLIALHATCGQMESNWHPVGQSKYNCTVEEIKKSNVCGLVLGDLFGIGCYICARLLEVSCACIDPDDNLREIMKGIKEERKG